VKQVCLFALFVATDRESTRNSLLARCFASPGLCTMGDSVTAFQNLILANNPRVIHSDARKAPKNRRS